MGLRLVDENVVVRQVEVGIKAVEYNNLDLGIGLQLCNEVGKIQNGVWIDQIDRRVAETDAPIAWCMARHTYLSK
jgi:hypothetical protein